MCRRRTSPQGACTGSRPRKCSSLALQRRRAPSTAGSGRRWTSAPSPLRTRSWASAARRAAHSPRGPICRALVIVLRWRWPQAASPPAPTPAGSTRRRHWSPARPSCKTRAARPRPRRSPSSTSSAFASSACVGTWLYASLRSRVTGVAQLLSATSVVRLRSTLFVVAHAHAAWCCFSAQTPLLQGTSALPKVEQPGEEGNAAGRRAGTGVVRVQVRRARCWLSVVVLERREHMCWRDSAGQRFEAATTARDAYQAYGGAQLRRQLPVIHEATVSIAESSAPLEVCP